MSDKNTSTLQSYIDRYATLLKTQQDDVLTHMQSATGMAQSALGSLTGSTADQHQGEAKQDKAQVEHDASHAGASFLGYSASSSGAVTKNDPARQEGSWNQTVGSGKEMLGNLVGSEGLRREGEQQNAAGKGQEAEGQVKDFGGGGEGEGAA
jgi:uncharacterized protein YjbJ (UPF0337 family)